MTHLDPKRKDTKLLLSVAGLVVAGAAGIALIGGLVLDDGDEGEAARASTHRRPVAADVDSPAPSAFNRIVEPAATPASYETVTLIETEQDAEDVAAFTIDPTENFVARGLEAWASRDFERAAAYFQAEADARPQRAWTHYMLGLSQWKAGRTEEAAVAMAESTRLDPESVKAHVNLARIRNDQGEYEGALEAARAALALSPGDGSGLFLEGRSLFNLGQVDESVASLNASIEADPENGYARNMLGLVLLRRGDPAEAVHVLARAAELEPEVGFIQNNLGMALELSGRRTEAVAAYRRSVEVDPTHAKAVANLARLEPAVDGEPTPDAPIHDELAEVEDTGIEIAAAEGEVAP